MTAWPDVASGIPYRAYFLFVGEIDNPDRLYVVLFIETIGIFFQQRPIYELITINCPSQGIATIRGF